jgi:hypothetical protein
MRKKRTVLSFPQIVSPNGKETLNYKRVAHKSNDGDDGLIFVHTWATGFQELIFRDYDHAKKWMVAYARKIESEQAA